MGIEMMKNVSKALLSFDMVSMACYGINSFSCMNCWHAILLSPLKLGYLMVVKY
jgi:hypothetical protein